MQNEGPNAFGGPAMTIEDKIKLFAELSGDERREVEQYVEAHGDERPHLIEMLRQSKRLARLLAGARSLGAQPPDDEALAFYAAMRSVDPDRMPAEYVEAFNRIQARIEEDPQVRRRLEDFERRGAEIQGASDPEAEFARLSKESLAASDGAPDGDSLSNRQARPGAQRPAEHGARKGKAEEPRSPRAAARKKDSDRSGSRRSLRRAAIGVAAVAVLYAALFIIGRASQPEHERLAWFESEELVVEGYENVRGEGVQTVTDPATSYIRALGHLREAQVTTLGLFPRIQEMWLDSAATLLREVIEMEPQESFLSTEAKYFLGKAELARGNVTTARTLLEQVAATPGVRSPDARALLERIGEL